MNLITIPAKREKFDGPGVVAERDVSRMSRRSWLQLRFTGLGGTDSAAMIFPDNESGPLTVYVTKVDRIVREDGLENELLDFGNVMEIPMRNTLLPTYLVRKLGLSPSDFRIYVSPWFYRSATWPWRTSNIDGMIEFLVDVVLPDGNVIPKGLYVLELKTAQNNQREKWAENSTPDRYFAQAQHYSGGMGTLGTVVFAMVNVTPELRFLPNHSEFQGLIVSTGEAMWKRIQDRTPPPAFGGDADLGALRGLYPSAGKELLPFTGLDLLASDLVDARKRRKAAEADVKFFEAQIKSAIGPSGGLVDSRAKAVWNRWPGKAFDTQALKLTYPALYERFKTKEAPGSRLTVTVKGETSEE